MSAAHKSERPVTVERPCTTCGKRFITKSDSREKLCPDCKDSFEPTVDGFFGQPILTPTKGQGHMAGFLGQLGRLIPIPGLIPMRDKTYRKGVVKTTKRKKRK